MFSSIDFIFRIVLGLQKMWVKSTVFRVPPAPTHVQLYFKLGRKTKYLQTKMHL